MRNLLKLLIILIPMLGYGEELLEEEPETYHNLDFPKNVITNLQDGYIRFNIQISVTDEKFHAALQHHLPYIRAHTINLVSRYKKQHMRSAQFRARILKNKLKSTVNRSLKKIGVNQKLERLYITKVVVEGDD